MEYTEMLAEVSKEPRHTAWHIAGTSFAMSTINSRLEHFIDGKPVPSGWFFDALTGANLIEAAARSQPGCKARKPGRNLG